jgi:TetR/AcrR family fatty acid metabolism transcriptional regulator
VSRSDKRRQIIEAAIRVFSRNGFYNSKVSQVAREAGVADGTIYLYFKNKDDLLIQVFLDTMELILSRQEVALAGVSDPVEKLERFIRVHFDVVETSPALAEVITVELRQSSKFMRATEMREFGRYLGIIARIVEEGQRAGVFDRFLEPRRVARALFGILDELALEWAISKRPGPAMGSADLVIHLMIDGLRVRPPIAPH